jgi:hypothetical protein
LIEEKEAVEQQKQQFEVSSLLNHLKLWQSNTDLEQYSIS